MTATGNAVTHPSAVRPVQKAAFACSSPRATVPGTSGRIARPSANIGLADWVLNFGCRPMSWISWILGTSEVVTRARAISASGMSARTARRMAP